MKTATEILKKHWLEVVKTEMDDLTSMHMQYCIDAMEEYGNQAKQFPTDLDIDNAARDYINDDVDLYSTDIEELVHSAYQAGAKHMRDNEIYIAK